MPSIPLRTLALVPLLALAACGSKPEATQAADEPTAPSSEWVAENPTEPAVPVDLPSTAMTNAPASPAAASTDPAASASPGAK